MILHSQECSIIISGHIEDEATGEALPFVNVVIQELNLGAISDEKGDFRIESVCPGEFHFIFSHIGCDPVERHIDVVQDSFITVKLYHTSYEIDEIVVEGESSRLSNQTRSTVGRQTIEDNADKNLASLLEGELGVSTLRNGSGMAKPVVHGLYGNRLTILNNGVIQSGQQWGNDHSPEIDPMVANKITVVRGTAALEYMGGNLGSLVLVEPSKIEEEPHLHGQASYVYETNGRGHNANIQLQKHTEALAWKVNTTAKLYGDRSTPDYFLNNTGIREYNLALQLEKTIHEKHFLSTYISTFNTEIGILRGSHIGNLTDLESALNAEIPFFTDSLFSYQIEAPRQLVNHHLAKFNYKYFISDSEFFDLILAYQFNDRREFDVRRGGRTDTPSLDLTQHSYSTDLRYVNSLSNTTSIKAGVQTVYIKNRNDAGTGVFPLIPDYRNFKLGLYSTLSKSITRWKFDIGLRFDYENQRVATITTSIPREIVRFTNNFGNYTGQISTSYNISKQQSVTLSTALSQRNPGINELYSAGLHQGVSGIEEGDPDLNSELSHKTSLTYEMVIGHKLSFEALAFYQLFRDFIFLKPQDEFRLTIRGAFPVFVYTQADAEIYGFDFALKYDVSQTVQSNFKYSYIQGNDTENNIPLVNIPTGVFQYGITYSTKAPINFVGVELDNVELGINGRYVWQQNNLLPEQDFVLPPDAYNVINLNASFDIISKKLQWRGFIKVNNLLDTRYRDYLNRQRYFADELGRSVSLGINVKF